MATEIITPLHLAGNTTENQQAELKELLEEAVRQAWRTALNRLDQIGAQAVIESKAKLQAAVAESAAEIIESYTVSDRYRDEDVPSKRQYPPAYKVRPIEAQVTELRRAFPMISSCMEKLARRPLLDGAEAWFAIPRWQAVATTYNEALEKAVEVLGRRRKFSNRIIDRMGPNYLRQCERTKLAQTVICGQQPGQDILVVPAQFGMLHRGSSARRARVSMRGHEFGLGAFAVACMLITHPERLSLESTLMIDCSGDEYSLRGDATFDRVPLFDFDISGIEFSIFYEDRARNLWGTPSGFVYKLS